MRRGPLDAHVIVLLREHQDRWADAALAAEDGRLTLTVPSLFGSVLISR